MQQLGTRTFCRLFWRGGHTVHELTNDQVMFEKNALSINAVATRLCFYGAYFRGSIGYTPPFCFFIRSKVLQTIGIVIKFFPVGKLHCV
mmetsp:Transcript_7985/g.19563  ORF Transcript_7985/g.19563 Transcript_7985/m.19563 type:complete len:89 (-) Transcript_7985:208-474(-)